MMPDNGIWKGIGSLVQIAEEMGLHRLSESWRIRFFNEDSYQRIHVSFVGEFNHGKSSLINAILGSHILPDGMTPTTQIDTYIQFGADANRVSAWAGADCIQNWDWERWQTQAVKLTADCLKTHTPDRIQIALASDSPVGDCVFIDTPGLNEATLTRESQIESQLLQSDIVVFILDANQALTRTESKVLSLISQKFPAQNRMIIINKCDRLDDDEMLEICAYVENAISPIVGNYPFYMISARKIMTLDWDVFIQSLTDRIDQCRLEHGITQAKRTESAIRATLLGIKPIYIAAMSLSNEQLNVLSHMSSIAADRHIIARLIEDFSHEIARLIFQAKDEISQFKIDFVRAMPREIDKSGIDDITDYFEDFIDEKYAEKAHHIIEHQIDVLHSAYCRMIQLMNPDLMAVFDSALHDSEFCFENVENQIKYPVSTGAFDAANSITGMLIQPMMIKRLERPMRDALRKMSEKAIIRRAESYADAFALDLTQLGYCIECMLREMGLKFNEYLSDMAQYRLNNPKLPIADID